jgi:hypothetical protein
MANGKGSLQLKTSLLVHNSVRKKNIITVTTYLRTEKWDMKTKSFFVVVNGDSHASWVRQGCSLGLCVQSDYNLATGDEP